MPVTRYHDNPYGFTVFVSQATPVNKTAQILTDMQTLGATWLRWQINWKLIDTVGDGTQTTSTYTWSGLDDVVAKANAAQINLLFCVQFPPGDFGQHSANGYYTQAVTCSGVTVYLPDATKTAKFAQQIAQRYNGGSHGSVQGIEIGNEDYDLFGQIQAGNPQCIRDNGGTPLANSMIASYPLVKAALPGCIVGAASTLSQSQSHVNTWIGQLGAAGAFPSCDYLNIHFYKGGGTWPTGTAPEAGYGFTPYWQDVQSKASQYTGGSHMTIWFTEAGYDGQPDTTTNPSVNTDYTHQSQYLTTELDSSRTSQVVRKYMWYTIGNNDYKSLTQGSGASETDVPAFTTLQNYISTYPDFPGNTFDFSTRFVLGTPQIHKTVRKLSTRFGLAWATDSFFRANTTASATIYDAANPNTIGWATPSDNATTGDTWASAGGSTGVRFSINNNVGQLTGTASLTYMVLPRKAGNCNTQVRFSYSNATLNSADSCGLVLAYQGQNNHYRIKASNNVFSINLVQTGTTTLLNSASFTIAANTYYLIRGIIQDGLITASIWADGSDESTATVITQQDLTFTRGQVGLFAKPNANADITTFTNFAVCTMGDTWDIPTRFNLQATITPNLATRFPLLDFARKDWRTRFVVFNKGIRNLAFRLKLLAKVGRDATSRFKVRGADRHPYGFDVQLLKGQALPQHTVDDLSSLGVKWLRLQVRWKDIEQNAPDKNYTWSNLDDAVSKCVTAGISVLVTIQDTPTVYLTQPCATGVSLPDAAQTATFAGAMAARYNGVFTIPTYGPMLIAAYQCDEQFDSPSNPASCRDATYWCNVYKQMVPAILAQSPTAFVGAPPLSTDQQNDTGHITTWMSTAYSLLWPTTPVDFFAFHFFHNATQPDAYDTSTDDIDFADTWRAMQTVSLANNSNTPIWVTEAGYAGGTDLSVSGAQVTYANQSAYFQQMLDDARSSGKAGIEKLFWYTLGEETATPCTPSSYTVPYSLTESTSTPATMNCTPPSPLTGGVGTSVKLPAWTTLQNYIGTYPTWTTQSNRDVTGRWKLAATAAKDLATRVKLQQPTSRNLASRLRLQGKVALDIATRWKLAAKVSRDLVARLRLQDNRFKNLRARFPLLTTAARDMKSRLRLSTTTLHDWNTRFLLQITRIQESATRWKLAALTNRDVTTRWKLAATVARDLTARWRVAAIASLDLSTRFILRPPNAAIRDLSTRFPIATSTVRDLATRLRLQGRQALDIASRWKLAVHVFKDLASRWKLAATRSLDIVSRLRLSAVQVQALMARLRLQQALSLDSATRLLVQQPTRQDMRSRLLLGAQTSRDLLTRWRLAVHTSRDLLTRWNLQGVRSQDIGGRANVGAPTRRDLSLRFQVIPTGGIGTRQDLSTRFQLQAGANAATRNADLYVRSGNADLLVRSGKADLYIRE